MDGTEIGTSGGAGLIGVLLGYLGFRQKVNRLETDLRDLKKGVRYTDTCEEIHRATNKELVEIKESQTLMRQEQVNIQTDLSTLLERTKDL